MPRLLENFPFAKVIAILASVFGIALGLCGATWFVTTSTRLSSATNSVGAFVSSVLMLGGVLELIAMAISAFGLAGFTVLWVISSVVNGFGRGSNDLQKLLDGSDDEKK